MFAYSKTNSITGITITELLEFDSSQLEKSKMIFEELKENKIICKGNFEDIEWSLTNQIETTNLRFEFDEILYNKEFKKRNMYKFQDFVNSIKCFVLLNIEYLNLKTLQKHLRYIKEYSHLTNFFNENYSKRGLDIFEKLLNDIHGFPWWLKR